MTDLNPYEEGLALELQEAKSRIKALTKERDHAWKMVAGADTRLGQSLGDTLDDRRKLAKAVEVLEQCEIMLRLRGHDEVAALAHATIAELKGESQDGMV